MTNTKAKKRKRKVVKLKPLKKVVKRGQIYSARPASGGHKRYLKIVGFEHLCYGPHALCREVTRSGTRKQGVPMASLEFPVFLQWDMSVRAYAMPERYELEK